MSIRHGGVPVPGFALGDADPTREHLHAALADVQRFAQSLSPSDRLTLQLGMEAAHLEESVAHGDWARARAHADQFADLVRRLTITPTMRRP